MEKRTIGGFIAALRKANGMTQKQLAEKLSVSDKAVSRWERDECAPDLSLIPVIAEVFGVTTDELLRGQRNNPDAPSPANAEAKTELQRRRLLKDAKTKYRIRSLICLCVALVGFIAALICNFGFLRAYIAFGIGAAFCVIAGVLQAVFTVSAAAAVDGDELEEALVNDHRIFLFSLCRNVCTVIVVLFAMLLPMTMAGDAYFGIEFGSWLIYGLLFGALALVICLVCAPWVLLSLSKAEFLVPEEKASQKARLQLRYIAIFAAVTILLFLGHAFLNESLPRMLVKGTSFDSWAEFKIFMETPHTASGYVVDGVYISFEELLPTAPVPIESVPTGEDNMILGEDGSVSYYEPYPSEQITAADGTVLCEYVSKNENVSMISCNFEHSEDGLPVTVYTYDDFRQVNVVMDDLVNPLYLLLYITNALLCFLLYRQKIRKL